MRFVLFFAAVFTASQLFAFRADEPVSGTAKTANGSLKTAPAKTPSNDQKEAVKSLDNVNVEWDAKTGVPASIRGKDLSVKNIGGKGLFLSQKHDFAVDAVAVMDRLTKVYRLRDASSEFKPLKPEADEFGFRHVRMNQMFKGLKVVGGQLIVHFDKSGQASQVNGRYIPDIDLETKVVIDANSAVEAAQRDLVKTGKPTGTLKGAIEIVVYADNTAPLLAYELTLVYTDEKAGFGNWRYWINARDGAVINRFNDIRKATATITGSMLSGEGGPSVSVTGDNSDGYYWLRYTGNHWKIYDYPNNRTARNGTDIWGTGTSTRAEMSAAYNFNTIQTYYLNIHSRNSYDNSGTEATANVHVTGGTDNAYWDPDTQQFYFFPGSDFGELTVLDVCAHEFTHAVTENTANLVYQNEPGALDESFSDIFGTIIEFASQPDGRNAYPERVAGCADWLLGEDCIYPYDVALRDMRDPQRFCGPSTYHGAYWYYGSGDNGGVHYNNGVQNHFFYLLCEGGNGTNDGISYNITGIGIANARHIAYRALTVYCTRNTGYTAARTAWISAATDLNASWVSTVQAAWSAVGVNDGSAPPPSAPANVQASDGTYSNMVRVTWSNVTNAITYIVYRNKSNNSNSADEIGKNITTTYDDTTALPRVIYYYWVKVLTSNGWSNLSAPDSGYRPASPYCSARLKAQGLNNDFDNDNKGDYALYNYQYGNWYIYSYLHSTWLVNGANFGSSTYLPVPGDYNGDGKSDVVVYSRNTATWMVSYTDTSIANMFQWGGTECIPAPGDYDGDGNTDFALYNFVSGAWYIFKSSTLTWLTYGAQWGGYGYIPAPGDYNGDGISDVVVYSEELALWLLFYTETGTGDYCDFSEIFGNYRYYVPAPGDYDGDSVTDFGLYDYLRGYWYIWSPVNDWIKYDFKWADYNGYYYTPVAGDYDGDGISDLAVYSPCYGDWYIYYMGSGSYAHATGFGGMQYVPITYWALYWYM